jgi:Thioredoxin
VTRSVEPDDYVKGGRRELDGMDIAETELHQVGEPGGVGPSLGLRMPDLDIDRDLAVAKRFGVKSIPTILVFRHGREVARLDGLITERELTAVAFDREAA